jgi:hypothetical protein
MCTALGSVPAPHFFTVLGIESRALSMIGKCFIMELQPNPHKIFNEKVKLK